LRSDKLDPVFEVYTDMAFGNGLRPSTRRQLFSAASVSLKIEVPMGHSAANGDAIVRPDLRVLIDKFDAGSFQSAANCQVVS
jgi:hypothetical protein